MQHERPKIWNKDKTLQHNVYKKVFRDNGDLRVNSEYEALLLRSYAFEPM